jgi:hypothetical protein
MHNLVNMCRSMKSMTIPCILGPLAQSKKNPLVTHNVDIGVIERINVLAKRSQAGMNFTNILNELYDYNKDNDSDYDADLDTDSEYNDDDHQTARMMPTMTMMISSQE